MSKLNNYGIIMYNKYIFVIQILEVIYISPGSQDVSPCNLLMNLNKLL